MTGSGLDALSRGSGAGRGVNRSLVGRSVSVKVPRPRADAGGEVVEALGAVDDQVDHPA